MGKKTGLHILFATPPILPGAYLIIRSHFTYEIAWRHPNEWNIYSFLKWQAESVLSPQSRKHSCGCTKLKDSISRKPWTELNQMPYWEQYKNWQCLAKPVKILKAKSFDRWGVWCQLYLVSPSWDQMLGKWSEGYLVLSFIYFHRRVYIFFSFGISVGRTDYQ